MGKAGFTLLEVLIALAIFGAVAAIPISLLGQNSNNKTSDRRNGATAAAQQELDRLRYLDPTTMATSGSVTTTTTIGGQNYQVVTTYCSTASYCTSGNNRHIKVDVYLDKLLYSVQTVYTQLR